MMTRNKLNHAVVALARRMATLALLLAWGHACLLSACTSDGEREPLPDWSEGYEVSEQSPYRGDGGTVVDDTDSGEIPEGFPENSFGIAISKETTYPIRLRKLDAAGNPTNEPCAVRQGDYQNPSVGCMIDMDELDLYVLGLKYDIIAPKGMCDFVEYRSYIFQNFPIGEGPTEVSCKKDQDGNVIEDVNAKDCVPRCPYDFSWQYPESAKAPNCCYGTYTLTITTLTDIEDENGNRVTEENVRVFPNETWDGNLAECYHGAAYLDEAAVFTDNGWPMAIITYIDRKEWIHTVTYDGLSDKYTSNVLLANYFEPNDHGGGRPLSLSQEEDCQDYVEREGFCLGSRQDYEILCLDDADEIIAVAWLKVREWNEEAQFDMDANPDTVGKEVPWNTPLDDIDDWATLTPGNEEYPFIIPPGRPK